MEPDPIAAALELLPWWVPWANVLLVAIPGALLAALATLVTAWSAGPTRAAAMARMPAALAFVLGAVPLLLSDQLQHVDAWVAAVVAALCAYAPAAMLRRRFAPPADPRPQALAASRAAHEAIGLLASLACWLVRPAIATAVALLLDPARLAVSAGVALAGVVAYVALGPNGCRPVLRAAGVLQPATARLVAAVDGAAARLARPAPRVWEIDHPSLSASARPGGQAVVFSRRCAGLLDDAELAALATRQLLLLTAPPPPFLSTAFFHAALAVLAGSRFLAGWIDATGVTLLCVALLVAAAVLRRSAAGRIEALASARAAAVESEPGIVTRTLEKMRAAEQQIAVHAKPPRRSGRALAASLAGALVVAAPEALVVSYALLSTFMPHELVACPRDLALALGHGAQADLLQRAAVEFEAEREETGQTFVDAATALDPDAAASLRQLSLWAFQVRVIPCEPDSAPDGE